jgi:uncharacterized protein
MASRVHDCLVNVHFGDAEQPEWMYRVKNDYFKKDDSIFGKTDFGQLLDEMDANGVERAVLSSAIDGSSTTALQLVEKYPDRFALTAGGMNLLRPRGRVPDRARRPTV